MSPEHKQMLLYLRQVLDRYQAPKALCDICGAQLSGWEAEETDYYGEKVSNHECRIDEQAQAITRRAWEQLTGGSPTLIRAKGYAVR